MLLLLLLERSLARDRIEFWQRGRCTTISIGLLFDCDLLTCFGNINIWLSAILCMSNQSQYDSEASRSEEASVLCICDLPYLTEDVWGQSSPLEELDSDITRHSAEAIGISFLE